MVQAATLVVVCRLAGTPRMSDAGAAVAAGSLVTSRAGWCPGQGQLTQGLGMDGGQWRDDRTCIETETRSSSCMTSSRCRKSPRQSWCQPAPLEPGRQRGTLELRRVIGGLLREGEEGEHSLQCGQRIVRL